jgi:hypothetical protein
MRYVFTWLTITLVFYALAGMWVGERLRVSMTRVEQSVIVHVNTVTEQLNR